MPRYDYKCENCGHEIPDQQQSIKDSPLVNCPSCKEARLQRVIGQTSFVLRGGGWANQGYGSSRRK